MGAARSWRARAGWVGPSQLASRDPGPGSGGTRDSRIIWLATDSEPWRAGGRLDGVYGGLMEGGS